MSRSRATRAKTRNSSKGEPFSDPRNQRGFEAEVPRKRKTWTKHDLRTVSPITPPLRDMYDAFIQDQKHVVAHGSAGTGKTLASIWLAMNEILTGSTDVDRLIIVRSSVPSRDIGFLPGTEEEKMAVYERPYRDIFEDLFGRSSTYEDMKEAGLVEFMSSSFVRGVTWDNAVVVVDEFQNMTLSEFDSVVTRIGRNSRLLVAGDAQYQQDLNSPKDQSGAIQALKIAEAMKKQFAVVPFTVDDILRSGFVKSWIATRYELKI